MSNKLNKQIMDKYIEDLMTSSNRIKMMWFERITALPDIMN